jgi:rod shape-determining protein MreD
LNAYAKLIVMFIGAMGLQWWWSTRGSIMGVAPQLLLVLTVTNAARYGPLRGMCLGFFWGLFLDVMSARMVGANALALTIVAYGTGSMRRQIDLYGVAPQALMVFSLTLVYFLIMGLLGLLFLRSFLWVGWAAFIIDPFYNALLAALVVIFGEPWLERPAR